MTEASKGGEAFAMYRIFLWTIGVWPMEKRSVSQSIRYIVAAVAQATFFVHTFMEIFLSNGKISDIVDVFFFCSAVLLTFVKHTCLHVYKDKIRVNLKLYLDDWKDTKDQQFLQIMKEHVNIYKYQFNIYNFSGYIGTTLFACRSILVNAVAKRQLEPGEVYNYQFICKTSYLSQETLSRYYPVILAVQYIQCMYACTSGACTDCFFFGLVFHLCAQFEILKIKWERLGTEDIDDPEYNGDNSKQIINDRTHMNELIIRHKKLMKLGENLETCFNKTILIQLLISIVLICMSGCSILVAILTKDWVTMLISTNSIMFMATETMIYGYASDYLMSQSESIVQAVYSSRWYNMETSMKTKLIFVMMRARRPLYITAGKFFYITRNTIVMLFKTCASYLSVLRLTLEVSHQEGQL